MSVSKDYLSEIGVVFSGKNKYYNFDTWKESKNGKLFVCGLPGSGISSLGNVISNKYNTEYVNLSTMAKKLFIDRYGNKTYDALLKNSDGNKLEHIDNLYNLVEKYIIGYNKKCVMAGSIVSKLGNSILTNNNGVIIIQTSAVSSIMGNMRNRRNKLELNFNDITRKDINKFESICKSIYGKPESLSI